MIALLNLISTVIFIGGFYFWWRTKKVWVFWATVGLMVIYSQIQPSYMPKGQIYRSSLPELEQTEAAIQDRLTKPDALNERDQRMKESVQSGLDFKQ